MRQVDTVLEDPAMLDVVYEALACRWKNSRTRGRKGTPVDVVIRLLVLKHMRNWSYAVLEREHSRLPHKLHELSETVDNVLVDHIDG